MGKKIKYKEVLESKKIIEKPEEKLVVSLICLIDNGKSFTKQNSNTIKDIINWLRKIENESVRSFLDKSRKKGGFSKEKKGQENYKLFEDFSKNFENHKITIVEEQCFKNTNYGHCHVDNSNSKKLIRIFGTLVGNKFCIFEIDWEGKRNH